MLGFSGALGAELGSTAVAMLRPLRPSWFHPASGGAVGNVTPSTVRPGVVMSQPAARNRGVPGSAAGGDSPWCVARPANPVVAAVVAAVGSRVLRSARAEGFEPPTDGFG